MSFLESLFWSLSGASRSRGENPQGAGGKRTEAEDGNALSVYKTSTVQDTLNILF